MRRFASMACSSAPQSRRWGAAHSGKRGQLPICRHLCALQLHGRRIGRALAPLQVGVGTAGGTETVAHALASVMAEDPENVV